jgi:hypothetical protein
MTHQDQAIDLFRRRLTALFFWRQAVGFATLWLFVWGTGVLALRASVGMDGVTLLWGAVGLVPCFVLAWIVAVRQTPRAAAVRALLDRESHCGGLLMAGAEKPLGDWEDRLPAVTLPAVRWRSRRAAMQFLAASAFVALAFLVPQRLAGITDHSLDVSKEVEQLAQQADALKEEKILTEAKAEEYKEKLDRLRDEAKGKDPSRTLEALDHLQDLLQKTAKEAANDASRKNEELARDEALAESLRKRGKDDLKPAVKNEAMAELARLTRKHAKENEGLAKDLDDEKLAGDLDSGALSEEDLKKLSKALKDAKGDLKRRLEKLVKLKLIDAKALKDCDKCGEAKTEELLALLKEGTCGS